MKKLLVLFLFAALFQPGICLAERQPISISLAECSVIYDILAIESEKKWRHRDKVEKLKKSAEVFKKAAYKQAKKEGRKDPEGYITGKLPEKYEKWHSRYVSSSVTKTLWYLKDNLDWAQYCGKLGRHKGILPID